MLTNKTPAELLEQYGDDDLHGQTGEILHKRIELLHGLVVGSEIPEKLAQWRNDEKRGLGGRPALIDDTAVLVIMLALAIEGSPLLVTRMADALTERLHPESRKLLGVYDVKGSHAQWYDRIHRCLHGMLKVIDPKPGPRYRRLTHDEHKQVLAARDRKDGLKKMDRLDWVTNELVHLSVLLAGGQMDNWHGNMTIDATVFGVFNSRGAGYKSDRAATEYDAWWYVRDSAWRDNGPGKLKKAVYGFETHLIAASTNEGFTDQDDFPTLILGMSMSKPSEDVATYAMRAFNQVDARHHDRIQGALVTADRGYFASTKEQKLQLPLRALGLGIVTDYKIEQLGIQAGQAGAILVDGNWYCPSMPEDLINASVAHRNDEIDDVTYYNLISSRKPYLLRRKDYNALHGTTKMMCPAAGPNPTVQCPLKALGCAVEKAPTLNIRPQELPRYPDTICTNKSSVTFDPVRGAKFQQELQYKSPEWRRMYSVSRNTIETANAHLKDENREGLAASGRRRVRGYAAQYLFIATLVFASNVRRIDTHRKRSFATQTGSDPRRFVENSLDDYRRKEARWWKTGTQRFGTRPKVA